MRLHRHHVDCKGIHVPALGVTGTVALVGGVLATTFVGASTGIGYLVAGIALLGLCVAAKRLRTERGASARAAELSDANAQLNSRIAELRDEMHTVARENNQLVDATETLKRDVQMFKETVGLVGEGGESLLEDLRQAWRSYKTENDRHEHLVGHQARLHLWQLIQHFDTNADLQLTDAELAAAIAYLKASYPALDTDKLVRLSMRDAEEVLGLSKSYS